MELDKFEILEEKIAGLVEKVSLLKEEKRKAYDLYTQKEREIQKLNEKLNELNQEKELVRSKVEQLLTKLEEAEEIAEQS
jgi:cell division protein ZapB